MEKVKKIFSIHIFLLFFVLFCIILLVAKFLSYNTIAGDDVWQIFFVNDFFYELTHPDHGRYLAWMQMKILGSWLPQIIGIHPQEFISIFSSWVRGINIAILCLSISYFVAIRHYKKFLLPLLTIFAFVYYSSNLISHNISEINNLSPHFGYQFGLMIFLIFFIVLAKYLLKDNVSKINIICCSLISFLSSLNDTFAVIGIISLVILSLLLFINKSFFEKKHVLFPAISFVIGAFISLYGMFLDKHVIDFMDSEQNTNFFLYWFEMLKTFIPQYFQYVFSMHLFLHIFIIVLFVICFKQNKNNQLIILALSMYLGVLGFFASLITGGTETFYQKGLFWIAHNDLQLILQVILLSIFLLLLGEYLHCRKNLNIILKKFILSSIFVYISFLFLSSCSCFDLYISKYKGTPEVKKQAYIAEKMYLFYAYQSKEAYLPINLLSYPEIASSFWVGMFVEQNERYVDLYEINANNPAWKERDEVVNKIKTYKMDNCFYVLCYMPQIYSLKNPIPFYFLDDEAALNKFEELGGKFTDEELNNINFNRLYDIDFVLNKK